MNDSAVGNWSKYASGIKNAANARLWNPSANLYRDNGTVPLTTFHTQDGNSWAVLSNLTTSPAQNAYISTVLAKRWGPYGAPAPEAGTTVSPFLSGFELQAYYIAGQAQNAVKLMKFMWGDFMLDNPHMTNSTLIEGYSTNGNLHDAQTFHAAGLQVTGPAGKTWKIAPQLGGLKTAEAGYQTSLGNSSLTANATDGGGVSLSFKTPAGTTGSVVLAYAAGNGGLVTVSKVGATSRLVKRTATSPGRPGTAGIHGLEGGKYTVELILNRVNATVEGRTVWL